MKQETNIEARQQVRDYFRQMNIIFAVFLSGIVLFLISVVIVVHYNGAMDPSYTTFLYIFAPISAIALLILGYRLYIGRVENGRKAEKMWEKMEAFRGAAVLRMILMDGAAFVQLIAYIMTADQVFIILSVVVATMFMLYRPHLETFIKEMELSDLEAKVIRDHAA